jgi:hypothetical protein
VSEINLNMCNELLLREKMDIKTPRPTKWAPPSYDDKMSNWKKAQKPKWKKPSKPTKYTSPKQDKPTYTAPQEYDHEPMYESETYEKEAASFNPYDIRKRRSAMRAQLEKSIDDEIAGLEELDELERQEEAGVGVKQVTGLPNGERCNSRWQCSSICCSRYGAEFGTCKNRVAKWWGTDCMGQ